MLVVSGLCLLLSATVHLCSTAQLLFCSRGLRSGSRGRDMAAICISRLPLQGGNGGRVARSFAALILTFFPPAPLFLLTGTADLLIGYTWLQGTPALTKASATWAPFFWALNCSSLASLPFGFGRQLEPGLAALLVALCISLAWLCITGFGLL